MGAFNTDGLGELEREIAAAEAYDPLDYPEDWDDDDYGDEDEIQDDWDDELEDEWTRQINELEPAYFLGPDGTRYDNPADYEAAVAAHNGQSRNVAGKLISLLQRAFGK